LHCTSGYPTPPEESDLNTIPAMAARYDVVVGLSDHTLGPVAPIAAVALGARVIEKHFTLSRADGGPDAAFSLEPQELRELVVHANLTHKAIGGIRREGRSSEATQRPIRRSLYAAAPIAKGDVLTEANVRSIRPGHGLPPRDLPVVLGCRAACDIPFGTALDWSLIDRSSLEG
jgi:N-acetylneuraminate synthase